MDEGVNKTQFVCFSLNPSLHQQAKDRHVGCIGIILYGADSLEELFKYTQHLGLNAGH